MKNKLIVNPKALKWPFVDVGIGLIFLTGLSVGLNLPRALTEFLLLAALLVLGDWYFFHRNNLKEYWKEVLANKGVAPSYDRQWNEWDLTSRVLHIVILVAISMLIVMGFERIFESVWYTLIAGVVLPIVTWYFASELTLPKRTQEPERQD